MVLAPRKTFSMTGKPMTVKEDSRGCLVAHALDDDGEKVLAWGYAAMEICPEGDGSFSLEYDAGMQRARFGYLTKEALCFKHKEEFSGGGYGQGPRKMVPGYVTWIGLDCKDKDVADWLKRHGAGRAGPGVRFRK